MAYGDNNSNTAPQAEPIRPGGQDLIEQPSATPMAELPQVNTSEGGLVTAGGQQLEFPSYYEPTVDIPAKSQVLEKGFGRESDYIELHIYDLAGELLLSEEDFKDYTYDPQSVEGKVTSQIDIDPILVLQDRGFTSGKFRIILNLQRKKIFNTFEKLFAVKTVNLVFIV